LAPVARAYKTGAAGPQELFDTFITARLWWAAARQPGLPVVWIRGKPVVPVFSSEAELVKLIGHTKWLSTTGLHLLSLLPPGVTLVLDLASDHRLSLNPAAVRLEYALVLSGAGSSGPGTEAL
jgi:hypothetical protein